MSNNTLGRGLSALIPDKINKVKDLLGEESPVVEVQQAVLQLSPEKIKPNPQQPRRTFDHQDLEDLISSIKEYGIIQPLIVSKSGDQYFLIAGERRLRSAEMLELKTVPVIVREVNKQQQLEVALIENIQRKDLNAIEQALGFQRLIDEFNLTQEQVGERVGKSRPVIANTIRLLSLPEEIQKAIIDGKIAASAARLIAGLPEKEQMKFFKKIISKDLTVRAAEGEAQKISVNRHERKLRDPNLVDKEDRLKQALSTNVKIKKSGSTGEIIIDFYSEEELVDIVNKISEEE
ncbi:ParB/RepB/Spo0J family partition protein [Patescibacteria group bacterium]|nr:ParB/RepB/Spo0J family partition protein [Patescibacteria group bacterium]